MSKGSITPLENKTRSRCRRWRLRVGMTRDGKYKQLSRNFAGSYSEAKDALEAFVHEVEGAPLTGRTTCKEWFAEWQKQGEGKLATATLKKRQELLDTASEFIGYIQLRDVTCNVIENMYSKLLTGQRVCGRALSGTRVGMVHSALSTCFKAAKKAGLIANNPCKLAERPKNSTPEKKALNQAQLRTLEESLNPTKAPEFAVLLAFKTGLRRGELFGLQVGDFDQVDHCLRVERAFTDAGELKEPKTKNSVRTLPLTESVEGLLETRISAIDETFAQTRRKLDVLWPQLTIETPLMCNEVGERMKPHSLDKWWARNRPKFGLDDYTIHELRHSYISIMVARGADLKVVSELAGHASVKTTSDIYTHTNKDQIKNAVERFGL